jgi:hypothetical protein
LYYFFSLKMGFNRCIDPRVFVKDPSMPKIKYFLPLFCAAVLAGASIHWFNGFTMVFAQAQDESPAFVTSATPGAPDTAQPAQEAAATTPITLQVLIPSDGLYSDQTSTLTLHVYGSASAGSGTVWVDQQKAPDCQNLALVDEQTTCTLAPGLSIGNHTLRAEYYDAAAQLRDAVELTRFAHPLNPVSGVTASTTHAPFGEAILITAIPSHSSPGEMEFYERGGTFPGCMNVRVQYQVGQCTLSHLSPGEHTIIVYFKEDQYDWASTLGEIVVTVEGTQMFLPLLKN